MIKEEEARRQNINISNNISNSKKRNLPKLTNSFPKVRHL
jgi:hypothetical protein